MFRISLLIITAPAVLGIIVKDPPLTGNEYNYSYQIDEPSTGDSKSQHEVRRGDVVSGAYSVLDPDGVKRTVEYTADPKHGFRAVVTKEAGSPTIAAVQHVAPALQQQYVAVDKGHYTSYPRPEATTDDASTLSYETKRPVYYSESPTHEQPVFYFTPANEINSGNGEFLAEGQYFAPGKNIN